MKYLLIKVVILYFSLICISHSQELVSQSDYDVVSCDDCTTTATFSEEAIASNKLNEKIVVEPFDGVEKSMKELIKLKHTLNS